MVYLLAGVGGLFVIIVMAYIMLSKKMKSSDAMQIKQLRKGTQESKFSLEILYQKLYVIYIKLAFLKRYVFKIRRRLEIINIDDEYLTRKQTSAILTKALAIIIPVTLIIIFITKANWLLMCILLIFELFMIDTLVDGMVDKIDNQLLVQQVDFFAEIRHAYHEFNMVEEAIYQVAQGDTAPEMSRQAEKIYEILISDDPESELEKYYDIAPNSYLKEFAGISYLTKEFGDRTVDKTSLYLKNLNNISQEMQLEILKRDKLNYVFQSLSVISIVPLLALEPIKSWSVSQFNFTKSFYYGKNGMIAQILIVILTFICYILTRKLKDNGSTKIDTTPEHPWQEKVYNVPFIKNIVDMFIPKEGTKERRRIKNLIKDSAAKDKIEWIYVKRLLLAIVTFVASLFIFTQLHRIQINYIYTQPTSTYDIVGEMSGKDLKAAEELTKLDNKFIDKFKGKTDVTQAEIEKAMKKSKDYANSTDDEIKTAAKRVLQKLRQINSEYLSWFEMLLAMLFAVIGYNLPIWLLFFQAKMRQIEMEDEVMQFQTIILMLMRIERVNVEMILEWLERYSNIFREPISRCVNNYESGPWEALEAMKDEVNYKEFIRIIESLQAAVERIPIAEAFDELDSERDYYQERRKESNARLISKKGMIGKVIGFAPMVCLFVGYLIIPLVVIGLTSMSSSFNTMASMT
jgi:hypothetical protein